MQSYSLPSQYYTKIAFIHPMLCTSVSLMILNNVVIAINNQQGGFSYITFSKSDICSNIFSDNPCGYMKNILKVFLDNSEKEKLAFVDTLRTLKEEFDSIKEKFSQIDRYELKVSPKKVYLHSRYSLNDYINNHSAHNFDFSTRGDHILSAYSGVSKRRLNINVNGVSEEISSVSL